MKIIVCLKQVPASSQVEVDPCTGVLKREGVASKMNPYDLYALELALQLSHTYGGGVQALTMGPPQARSVVSEAIYMGASAGVVVSDRRFAGSDVLATSYTLSQAIRSGGDFDLIICGKQTTDGDTAQVGAELAEFLDIPHINNVTEINGIDHGVIKARVNLDRDFMQLALPLPCLISVDGNINTPRLPSYKLKQQLSTLPITMIALEDLADHDEGHYGLNGSPTQVERIFPPDTNSEKYLWTGTGGQLAERLYGLLRDKKFIKEG